jgi:hypothetical protein
MCERVAGNVSNLVLIGPGLEGRRDLSSQSSQERVRGRNLTCVYLPREYWKS